MSIREFKAISAIDGFAYQILVEDFSIQSITRIPSEPDMPFFAPGLLDTQVNGYFGYDYSDPELTTNACNVICQKLMHTGTLQHFATIVTSPKDVICHSISTIVSAFEQNEIARAGIAGIHIEGPFISPEEGFRGAHNITAVREADLDEFDHWLEIGQGLIKVITVAPEVRNVVDLIRHATSRKVVCAIGHTNANAEQIDAAVEAGASISTHLGNGSKSVIERLNNHIWVQLAEERLKASIISDSFHLPPAVLKVFARTKGPDNIILVSDVAPVAGLGSGYMKWGDISVEVCDDGSVRLPGTPYLAGASSSLLLNIANFCRHTKITLAQAIAMATLHPAKLYSLDVHRFDIHSGSLGQFILFDFDKDTYKITLRQVVSPYIQS